VHQSTTEALPTLTFDDKKGLIVRRTIPGLIAWLALSLLAGWIGSRHSPGDWYASLSKPAWTPPNYVFAPVWISLYLIMGTAAWLVWRRHGLTGAVFPLGLFVLQLVLNGAWSWLFFGRHLIGAAFADIIALLIAILLTLLQFWKHCTPAGLLLLPYLCWVTFAAALNLQLWLLNR
jgi:tryptophan-rich sensory protein